MSRPKFVPTKEQRLRVKSLSAYGINQEGIARMVGLRSPKTLRKHFRQELDFGAIEAVAQVSQAHYQMAKSGKYPVSTIHFLNSRVRWLEVQNGAEKREVRRIVWRTAKQLKKQFKERDGNPSAAAPTSDSATSNKGEEQEAGPETALATQNLEATDAQQPPTATRLQAPRAKEPDAALD